MDTPTITTVRPDGDKFVVEQTQPERRASGIPGIFVSNITLNTTRGPQMIDLTDLVQEDLDKCGVKEGYVLVLLAPHHRWHRDQRKRASAD